MVAIFATSARTDMAGVIAANKRRDSIKIFRHSGGWSVECSSGILLDNGVDKFSALEPLVDAPKAAGISTLTLEP